MRNSSFRFKQFEVQQEGCAMKVGTDGVLLGAWCGTDGVLLDIGTGTGVVALMTAQRGATNVDAVEIDHMAAAQAERNFAASPWSDHLKVHCVSLQDYTRSSQKRYDTIVSNPPYFINSLKCPEHSRVAARHTEMLSYEDLASCVVKLLKDDGQFFAIFPYEESGIFIAIAALHGLYLNARLDIRPIVGRAVKRVIVEMSKVKSQQITSSELSIAYDNNRTYTDKYKELTAEFYLKF